MRGVATTLIQRVTVGRGGCHHNTPPEGVRTPLLQKGGRMRGGAHHSSRGCQEDEGGVSSQRTGGRARAARLGTRGPGRPPDEQICDGKGGEKHQKRATWVKRGEKGQTMNTAIIATTIAAIIAAILKA